MPNRNLFPGRRSAGTAHLSGAAIIGFSLTLVAAGIAMLVGLVPQRLLPMLDGMDATVVLLFVPLCALTMAILAEAVRASFSDSARPVPARPAPTALEPWRPGQGEG